MTESDRAIIAKEYLGETFDKVLASYLARLTEVAASEPWAADKLRSLALAQKIGGVVRQHIEAVAAGKAVEDAERDHRRKIEAMSPERRKVLGISL